MNFAEFNYNEVIRGEISLRLEKVLQKWISFAASHYSDWDVRPRCGHFFGGVYNYEIETSATTLAAAVLWRFGEINEESNGITRRRLAEMAVRSLRYLCFTHHTGPEDCVRETGRVERTSGKKWGFIFNNFFMESQTGVSVSMLGLAAWLLNDILDDETTDMVCRVLISYADEFCDMVPGTGVYNDTQCEENAWTSLGIAAALYMLPGHPSSGKWLDGYINWSLNTVTTFKDKLALEKDKVSGGIRSGLEFNGKSYGISSVNFHPDFTTENHGYVHPDYMGGGIILRASSSVFALLSGKEPLGSLLYNMENLYEKTLKPWCAADGNPVPFQGQDWFYHKHQNKLFMHAAMNLLHGDRDAAMFERACLDIVERRQEGNGNGRLIERKGETLEVTPGRQSAFDMEYGASRTISLAYLLHLLKGNGAEPSDCRETLDRLSGNHFYPFGGVYVYRTTASFASFSTRCSIMGLSMPIGGLWDITPDFQSFTGIIRERDEDDGYYKDKKINWKDMGIEAERISVKEYDAGFSIVSEVKRAGDAILQASSFTALPGGESVYAEKLKVLRDVELDKSGTGRIGIGNENLPLIKEKAKGYRDIWFENKKVRFKGYYEGDDVIMQPDGIRYMNVDGCIGYLLYGNGGVEYRNTHNYPKWKGLEDTLVLNPIKPGFMANGEETEIFTVVAIPNASPGETAEAYENTLITEKTGGRLVIRTAGARVHLNFTDDKASYSENFNGNGRVEIYRGITAVKGEAVSCSFGGKGFESGMDLPAAIIECDDVIQDLVVRCSEDTGLEIMNNSDGIARYRITICGHPEEVRHAGGETRGFAI